MEEKNTSKGLQQTFFVISLFLSLFLFFFRYLSLRCVTFSVISFSFSYFTVISNILL